MKKYIILTQKILVLFKKLKLRYLANYFLFFLTMLIASCGGGTREILVMKLDGTELLNPILLSKKGNRC